MKFVITGGPGFGKTTIINALRKKGYWGGLEIFDAYILEQLQAGGTVLPWVNRKAFERATLPLKVEEYLNAPTDSTVQFFDRGFPDHLAYCKTDNMRPLADNLEAIKHYRYDGIFLVPPWKDIWVQDEVRREKWEQAVKIHNNIEEAYRESGYTPITIPIGATEERCNFVLSSLGLG